MPLRSKLILFAVIMLLLFLGLSAGAFVSLRAAAREAEDAREGLARLTLVTGLGSACTDFVREPDPVVCDRMRRNLSGLRLRSWSEEEQPLVRRVLEFSGPIEREDRVANARALRAALEELEARLLQRTADELQAAREPARLGGSRLLFATLLLALGGSASFAWLYSRLVRERRHLESRLRTSEKLAALGTLAAGLAHEINNPLATISLSAEALSTRLDPEAPEGRYVKAVSEEADRCRRIVGGLSDLSRGASLDLEPVDPPVLAREAVEILERDGRLPPGGIQVEAAGKLPLFPADRGKLQQVLVNLLQNAVDATEGRGRVALAVRIRDGRLRFAVEDDGRGIPARLLPRIFEPFFTDKPRGIGLGLALCHRIAELHGGELIAESDGPGRGSRFTLVLPLESAHGS